MSINFEDKRFDVEHALSMYATSFVAMPAAAIYDKEAIANFSEVAKDCHIYLIGQVPKVSVENARREKGKVVFELLVQKEALELDVPTPDSYDFGTDEEGYFLVNPLGEKLRLDLADLGYSIKERRQLLFKVLYVGQAFGANGGRNAIMRLQKHETLQKIAVQGIPDTHELSVLLLAMQPDTRVITSFNPRAKIRSEGRKRIANGLDKLYGTSAKERVTLYEASLIRYFQPLFNKEFKDSFPSTNMKVLSDCYKKDFSMIIAEIIFDHMPFDLYSDAVEPSAQHSARHDLHSSTDRKMFFSRDLERAA